MILSFTSNLSYSSSRFSRELRLPVAVIVEILYGVDVKSIVSANNKYLKTQTSLNYLDDTFLNHFLFIVVCLFFVHIVLRKK
jgi:hypothetical protein